MPRLTTASRGSSRLDQACTRDPRAKPWSRNGTPAATLARKAKTPFPGESAEYRKAREALLAEEIDFRGHMTQLAEQRRALPPAPVIAQDYRFKDANGAEIGLKQLFGDHDTLVT